MFGGSAGQDNRSHGHYSPDHLTTQQDGSHDHNLHAHIRVSHGLPEMIG